MGSVNSVRDPAGGFGDGGEERSGTNATGVRTRPGTVERCFDCRRDLPAADSCTTATIAFPDGEVLPAIRHGANATEHPDRCRGCGVAPEGFHHPFCPIEACPRCNGRLATCGCLDADKTRC